jgi:hypothetical protein
VKLTCGKSFARRSNVELAVCVCACGECSGDRHAPAPAPTNIPSRRQSRGSTSQHAFLPKLLLASTSNPVSQNVCLDVNSRKGKTKATRRTSKKREYSVGQGVTCRSWTSLLHWRPFAAPPAAANRREPTTGRLLQFMAARMPPYSRICVNDNDTSSDRSELNATTKNQRL